MSKTLPILTPLPHTYCSLLKRWTKQTTIWPLSALSRHSNNTPLIFFLFFIYLFSSPSLYIYFLFYYYLVRDWWSSRPDIDSTAKNSLSILSHSPLFTSQHSLSWYLFPTILPASEKEYGGCSLSPFLTTNDITDKLHNIASTTILKNVDMTVDYSNDE